MNKNFKKILSFLIVFIIGISTTVGAVTIFNSKDITYSSDKTTKTNVKKALDELYENLGKCPKGQYCYTEAIGLSDKVELGDYIRMTPPSTSYTISEDVTGYDSDQTINPSELNLWRVIRKNDDGTVEIVSDKVSSTKVTFSGKEGYINLVGTLNKIAAQYTNSKYVESTRHIGYSNQTEKITDISKLSQTTPPWTNYTSSPNQWTGCNTISYLCGTDENLGAGDIGYQTDYNLVYEVYGNMIGKNLVGTATSYWLASRSFVYGSTTGWLFDGRYVSGASGDLYGYNLYKYVSGFQSFSPSYAIRPIATIKADIQIISGDGKSAETAYNLD